MGYVWWGISSVLPVNTNYEQTLIFICIFRYHVNKWFVYYIINQLQFTIPLFLLIEEELSTSLYLVYRNLNLVSSKTWGATKTTIHMDPKYCV